MNERDNDAQPAAPSPPEFGSLSISIDHLVLNSRAGDPTVIKVVFSTETAAEALQAQLDYFGDVVDWRDKPVMGLLHAGETQDMIYVYVTPRDNLSNVIVDVDAYQSVMSNDKLNPDGTVLGGYGAIIALASDMTAKERAEKGAIGLGPSRILGFAFDTE